MNSQHSTQWYIKNGDSHSGPYTIVQLRQLATAGELRKNSLIREANGDGWLRAQQIPVIFSTSPIAEDKPHVSDAPDNPVRPVTAPPRSRDIASPSEFVFSSSLILAIAAGGAAVVIFAIGILAWPGNVTSQPRHSRSFSGREFSTEELVARTSRSVALVFSEQDTGTGFVVEDGLLATNYHVVADAQSGAIQVVFPDETQNRQGPYRATVVAESPERDLALLRIRQTPPRLPIDTRHVFRRGQEVVVIGSPGVEFLQNVLPNAVTSGLLSSETEVEGFHMYQLSIAINPGNSGGPVFGMDGKVIGVVTLKSLSEEAIGFCIPAGTLSDFITGYNLGVYGDEQQVANDHEYRRLQRSRYDY